MPVARWNQSEAMVVVLCGSINGDGRPNKLVNPIGDRGLHAKPLSPSTMHCCSALILLMLDTLSTPVPFCALFCTQVFRVHVYGCY